MAKITEKIFEVKGRINQFLIESINSINIIKPLKKEMYFNKQFNILVSEKKFQLDKAHSILSALYMSITIILMQFLPLITIGLGSILASKNKITVGSIVALYTLTGRLQEPVRIIAESLSQEKSAMKLVDRLNIILSDPKAVKGTKDIDGFSGLNININEFSYENDKPILKDISMEIMPEQIVVLKGKSGSGKSTIIKLIMGMIELENGIIEINNKNIKDIDNSSLWEFVLLQGQESLILQGTIYENLALGDNYTDQEINEVVEVTCLGEFIKSHGLHKSLSEKGKNLSGGQRQRINLARVLLRKPELLLLDEPTSSLDSKTSHELANNLVDFVKRNDITLIVISHKSEFDKYADNIYKLDTL